jgi:hypothetical protein
MELSKYGCRSICYSSRDYPMCTRRQRVSPRPSRIVDDNYPARPQPDQLGFPFLLEAVIATAQRAHGAYASLRTLLTFDSRVPLRIGLRALPREGHVVWDIIQAGLIERREGREGEMQSAVGLRADGRVWVGAPSDASASSAMADDLVGEPIWLAWTGDAVAAYKSGIAEMLREGAVEQQVVEAWQMQLTRDDAARILSPLENACLHAAPLQLFVEDRLYSNFRVNNLPGKVLLAASPQSCFVRLIQEAPQKWDINDASFVFCADKLLRSGGPSRLEEANWTQLRPTILQAYMEERVEIYRAAGALPRDIPDGMELEELVDALAKGREEMRRLYQPYRHIYGVNLHKEECYTSRNYELAEDELVRQLVAGLDTTWNCEAACLRDLESWICLWMQEVVKDADRGGCFANPVEALLAATVSAAMALTGADIGMTRGLRSLLTLRHELEREAWQEIVSWELPAYYCCVLPSEKIISRYTTRPQDLADMLWAIAARMQYNAWHFVPGNLPPCSEVTERDYFFPPTVPDLAEWSDQHHRGHVVSGVRFSIRVPTAVTVGDRRFEGFADLRLLRQSGKAFAVKDLQYAISAARLIGHTLDRLAYEVGQSGVDLRMESFDARWYADRFARGDGFVPRAESSRPPTPNPTYALQLR